MEKITDKKQLSRLIMSSMKRGVITNCFNAPSFSFDIEEGRLYYDAQGDSLFLLRMRDSVGIINFYINEGGRLSEFAKKCTSVCALDLVTEIPDCDKASASDAELRLTSIVTSGGFEPILKRTMLERAPSDDCNSLHDGNVTSSCDDVKRMYDIMRSALSPVTGCVPTYAEFEFDVKNGSVFAFCENGTVKGILRYSVGKKAVAIKQLAVDREYRRCGIGERLVSGVISSYPDKRVTVWTGTENTAALSLYEKCGFVRLGGRSAVYRYIK